MPRRFVLPVTPVTENKNQRFDSFEVMMALRQRGNSHLDPVVVSRRSGE